jgi:uncharacterized protein (TIGR02611 family)
MLDLGPVGRLVKRIIVTTVGTALLCVGIVLLVIPGPGILLIIAGLAVLATEYLWAKSALDWTKARAKAARNRMQRSPQAEPPQ